VTAFTLVVVLAHVGGSFGLFLLAPRLARFIFGTAKSLFE
jgi:hypothetical protein